MKVERASIVLWSKELNRLLTINDKKKLGQVPTKGKNNGIFLGENKVWSLVKEKEELRLYQYESAQGWQKNAQ